MYSDEVVSGRHGRSRKCHGKEQLIVLILRFLSDIQCHLILFPTSTHSPREALHRWAGEGGALPPVPEPEPEPKPEDVQRRYIGHSCRTDRAMRK